MPDKTELTAYIADSQFIVDVIGTDQCIAEVGVQFAWLGAALRSSQSPAGLSLCNPVIQQIHPTRVSSFAEESLPTLVKYTIDFQMSEPTAKTEHKDGGCWHDVFERAVVVAGFPILDKKEHSLGLEIPLSVMAELVGWNRLTEFDNRTYIKGFSKMFVVTRYLGDMWVWHYVYNSDGERVSYLDYQPPADEDVTISDPDTARHVIGWCSDAKLYKQRQSAPA